MTIIRQRQDTAANWAAVNPILAAGELGYETDTGHLKIGDNTTHWSSLPYLTPPGTGVSTVDGLTGTVDLTSRYAELTDGKISASALPGVYAPLDADAGTGGGPRLPANAAILAGTQPGHGWANVTNTLASVSDDTADFMVGSQSVKLTTLSNGSAGNAQVTGLTMDLTGMQLRLAVKVDDMSVLANAGLAVYAATSTAFTDYYAWTLADLDPSSAQHWMKSGEWVWITFGFADAVVTGSPTRTGITVLRVRLAAQNGDTAVARINGIAATPEPALFPNGVVSFGYDDSLASTYTEARKALDKYGWVGTEFVICDQIDSGGSYMTSAQLDALYAAGWDVSPHCDTLANHGIGYAAMTTDQAEASFRFMRDWFRQRGYTRSWDHLAYPMGAWSTAVLPSVAKYFHSARTTLRRTMETLRPADPLRVRSFSVGPSDTVATVTGKIDKAYANKQWLVLTFHNLVPTLTGSQNEALIADHQSIVDYCATKGIPVLPISDVLARLAGVDNRPAATVAPVDVLDAALGNTATTLNAVAREVCTAGITVAAGRCDVVCFAPLRDRTITKLAALSSGTAWTGATLARMGLYTVDPTTGTLSLVARTASDPTLFTAANTVYQRTLDGTGGYPASYTLKAGQRYAVAILGVGTTAGQLRGASTSSLLSGRGPIMGGTMGSGLADLPTSGTVTAASSLPWAELAT